MNRRINYVLAVDPGDVDSAAVWFDCERSIPLILKMLPNWEMRNWIFEMAREIYNDNRDPAAVMAIEYTPPYALTMRSGGSFVPRQVVDTAIEIGRFIERWDFAGTHELVSRLDVKKHLLGRTNGNDAMVSAALFERYGGSIKAAKGTKRAPGPLHGFNSHLYAALAVAVTFTEKRELAKAV